MSVIPCEQNKQLREKIKDFAETLKTESHTLGDHGLDEKEFYNSGLFRGAIERVRGQFSATMREKREFVSNVLNHMQDQGFIGEWEPAGEANRHDYAVQLIENKRPRYRHFLQLGNGNPIMDASKKWTMPIRNWKLVLNRFMIEFEDRLVEYV